VSEWVLSEIVVVTCRHFYELEAWSKPWFCCWNFVAISRFCKDNKYFSFGCRIANSCCRLLKQSLSDIYRAYRWNFNDVSYRFRNIRISGFIGCRSVIVHITMARNTFVDLAVMENAGLYSWNFCHTIRNICTSGSASKITYTVSGGALNSTQSNVLLVGWPYCYFLLSVVVENRCLWISAWSVLQGFAVRTKYTYLFFKLYDWGVFGSGTDPISLLILFLLCFFFLLRRPLVRYWKAQGSVVSNLIGMKFGRIVPQVNTQRLMESDFGCDVTSYGTFKMAAIASSREKPLARHVWHHWLAVCASTGT